MPQSLSLWGATYNNVPAVLLPKSTSGMAQFTDVSDTTAVAANVSQGTYFYTAAGIRTEGTATGGSMVIRDEEDEHGGTIRHITAGDVVQGTKTITENGTHDVAAYADAYVNVQTAPNLQAKTNIAPTTSSQTIQADSGYDGLSSVQINAMPSGTAGTPTASKGTVSNHAISVTPSVTNTTGYISGGTKTGTAVSVSASELVSGTYTVSASGTADVTNYASISVPAQTLPTSASSTSSGTSKATISRSTSDQYINIPTGYNSAAAYYKVSAVANGTEGTPTATKGTVSNHAISVTPSVTNTAGYISGGTKTGTAVSVSASELVSGNKEITENGENIDVTNFATVSVNVPTGGVTQDQSGYIVLPSDGSGGGGGGASNYVHGEFHTDSSAGVQAVTIPYTGSGYPIMAVVVVKGGAYASGTDWYDTVKQYAVAFWTMTKSNMATTPTYTTSGEENAGAVSYSYKSSSSSPTSYTGAGSVNINVFSSDNPTNNAYYACRFKSATSMYVKVEGSSTGLLVDTDYEYFIVYSS